MWEDPSAHCWAEPESGLAGSGSILRPDDSFTRSFTIFYSIALAIILAAAAAHYRKQSFLLSAYMALGIAQITLGKRFADRVPPTVFLTR